jgi:hypothetical protein
MKISEHCANVEADAGGRLLNGGYLRLYDARDALLAECRFKDPAFELATSGMARAHHPLVPDPDTKAEGEPVLYRAFMADGRTLVQEGTVGPPQKTPADPFYDMSLPTPLIVPHAEFHVTEFWYIRRR